jgi:hypothetical protein
MRAAWSLCSSMGCDAKKQAGKYGIALEPVLLPSRVYFPHPLVKRRNTRSRASRGDADSIAQFAPV